MVANQLDPQFIHRAVSDSLERARLPLSLQSKNLLINELTLNVADVENLYLHSLDADQKKQRAALKTRIDALRTGIQSGVVSSIDNASLAAASVVMPRLAEPTKRNRASQKANRVLDWKDFTDDPPMNTYGNQLGKSGGLSNVRDTILSGLGEGTGDDTPMGDLASSGLGGGGEFSPDQSTLPSEEDYSAIAPGRENLPAYDMSQKQKSAFAQQQLDNQLQQPQAEDGESSEGQPGQKGQESSQQPNQMNQLQNMQQDVSNQLRRVHGAASHANLEERVHHTSLAKRKANWKKYKKLLASDRKTQEAQAAAAGHNAAVQQSLQRKAMYYLGLKALNKYGTQIGDKLKSNIKTGSFSSFYFALALGIIKDLLDWAEILYGDPGIAGSIINIFVGIILAAVLFGEGLWFKRWLIKKFLGRAIVSLIVEYIPVFDYFPTYTIAILLMGYQNFKAIMKQKKALHELEQDIQKEVKKMQKSGAINERRMASLRKRLDKLKKAADA